MGEWTPLYITLAILFLIGGLVPAIISGFVVEGQYNQDSFIAPFIDMVENGFTIAQIEVWGWTIFDGIDFNPFSWFGSSVQDFIITQLSAFSYIPTAISVPLIIFCLVGLFYSIIKLLPTT